MKTPKYLISVVLLLPMLLLLQHCGPDKCQMAFSGKIVDGNGQELTDVTVALAEGSSERNPNTVESSSDGKFQLCVSPAGQYVVNISKIGYGLVSKVYTDTASNIIITMTTATVAEDLDANDNIVLEDNPPPTSGPMSANAVATSPLDTIPFVYDGEGRLIAFKAPPMTVATYDAAEATRGAGPGGRPRRGAKVEVPPGALVEEGSDNGNDNGKDEGRKLGKVTGSLSTIDIYNPDGMPGNYTVRAADGSIGWMETYGAADINFYHNGKKLQLRQGQYATITIPVDTITLLYYGKSMPETMPMLVYNGATGLWEQDVDKWTKQKVFASLTASKDSYVGKVSHFSTFNMDEEFSAPTCYRMCAAGIPTGLGGARIEVSVPGHIKPFFPFDAGCATGCPAGRTGHGVIYMKPNTPMGVRISDNAGTLIKATYVFIAGGASVPHMTSCDFGSCSGPSNIDYSACYVNTGGPKPGSMTAPILAVKRGYDLNNDGTIATTPSTTDTDEGDYFDLSWVFVHPGYTVNAMGNVVNPALDYKVEYSTAGNMDDYTTLTWCDIKDLDIKTGGQLGEILNTTAWKVDTQAVINTANDASSACLPLSPTIFLRVRFKNNGVVGYDAGYVVYKINMTTVTTSMLYTSFNEGCSLQ